MRCFLALGPPDALRDALSALQDGLRVGRIMSGMLSVRPLLAGTASGLGGALMVGGGAGLSALAGILLDHGEGAAPLLWLTTN